MLYCCAHTASARCAPEESNNKSLANRHASFTVTVCCFSVALRSVENRRRGHTTIGSSCYSGKTAVPKNDRPIQIGRAERIIEAKPETCAEEQSKSTH